MTNHAGELSYPSDSNYQVTLKRDSLEGVSESRNQTTICLRNYVKSVGVYFLKGKLCPSAILLVHILCSNTNCNKGRPSHNI